MVAEGKWYQLPAKDVLAALHSSKTGLTDEEVNRRLQEYGQNKFKKKKRKSPLLIFLSQFKSILVSLLIVAAAISILIQHWVDASVILIIVVLNAIFGFVQEFKAEKAIEALEELSAPKARVIRDNKERLIDAADLVPGDIVIVEQGDKVPTDLRLLEVLNLTVDESTLTGESTPVHKTTETIPKDAILADRRNLIFMNTIIANGRAKGVVVETGMHTEIGKIAEMIQTTKEKKTPMQQKLAEVARTLGIAVILICTIIFALGMFRGGELFDMFLTAIALAVAAVPEGLPAIITITLALGLEKLAKSKAIVRKLPAVETLGSCNIICTDKTGTLTKNEMTVRKIWVNNSEINVSGDGYLPRGTFTINDQQIDPTTDEHSHLLLHIGSLCNGASLYKEKNQWKITGDPTEAALIVLSTKTGLFKENMRAMYPNISEFSFDSKRKRMSTIHKHKQGTVTFAKGAPSSILNICDNIYENGRTRRLTPEDKKKISETTNRFANKALRVLGFAYKIMPEKERYSIEEVESNLTFVGLVGMIDPPRPEVKEALQKAKDAGIKVTVVTGDNKITATAVAKELGLITGNENIIEGKELDKLDVSEFERLVDKITIYARVSPHHKLEIVKALKKKGYVVAMTGDGINDAPALKEANIGVAMGQKGTDVAKEASDMILEDDNFKTIVSAIQQGRGVFDNIKKSIAFLLSGNIAEIMIVFAAVLIGFPHPLIAVQILWINLVTDGLPALALSVDPVGKHVMEHKPRPLNESVFHNLRAYLVEYPIILFIGAMILFWWFLEQQDVTYARTAVFTSIVVFEVFQSFSCHSIKDPIIKTKPFVSKWLVTAALIAVVLQIALINIPFLQGMFHTVPLSLRDWLIIFGFSSIGFIYLEGYKTFRKNRRKNL